MFGIARGLGTLIVVLVLAYGLGRLRAPALPEAAPPFALRTPGGAPIALDQFRGRTVVLNFWATWCGPCRFEIPAFSRFAKANPDVAVLGLVQDRNPEVVTKAMAEFGVDYPVVMADKKTLQAYGVSVFPTTVIVGPDGQIELAHAGIMLDPQLWVATR